MQSVDDPQPASAGSLLAAARRERNLTIDEVSERTRVRASLIDQIERDDYSRCGGTVYARGHLRSIATSLGLDPGPVLAAYDASHEALTGPVLGGVPPGEFDPLRGGTRRRRGGFRWGAAMIVSLAAVCLIAVIALLVPGSGSSGSAGSPRQGDAAAPPPTEPTPITAPSSTPVPAPSTAAPAGVNVVVAARDAQSWLEVRDDARHVLLAQLLHSGDSRTVTAPGALSIRMGNAGAVDVSCNGRNLGPSGDAGQVVTIRVSVVASGECEVGQDGRSPLAAGPLPSALVTASGASVD
ncbi:helix-turn-helix domain-containing protein [Frankia sp. AiPs1]|uniref:helix-turn-helix domain-containing protein n=1 Tax=Frankia sp. AiPs1 TaxID=573493 RepID=UPI002042CFFC|nr:helix-turn-helix domain-containing protein [Frankia sp. AiPs1]MCM3925033.1 helix-turn-helix domain-containing protein [Frankia sp. AiPs1]